MEQPHQLPESDEIDLVELLQKVWQGRYITILMSIIFALLGVLFALSSPNVYTASTTFITKGTTSIKSGIGSIASIAGLSLGDMNPSGSEIPPALYPMLVKSNPFIEALLKEKVPKDGALIGFQDYLNESTSTSGILGYLKKYTIGLPGLIKTSFSSEKDGFTILNKTEGIKRLTSKEESIYNSAKGLIDLKVDNGEGFVTLNVVFENPEVAAIIALSAQNLLQKAVINFKIKNAQELLTFTEVLCNEKRGTFETLQDELASFRDQHQNINSGLFENKLNRLETELAIASAIYKQLSMEVEQARIQVSRDTPIFTIINHVVIPNQRTSPKRTLIVLGFTFCGFLFGLGYGLIKEPFAAIRRQILDGNKSAQ
jgi:hypothetical protein